MAQVGHVNLHFRNFAACAVWLLTVGFQEDSLAKLGIERGPLAYDVIALDPFLEFNDVTIVVWALDSSHLLQVDD